MPFGSLEDFANTCANTFDSARVIANEHGRDTGAQNGGDFGGRSVNDRLQFAAMDHIDAEDEEKQEYQTNDR